MTGKARVQSPEVIAFAEQSGIDLSTVPASAEDGRISKSDVFRKCLLNRTGLPDTATNDEIVAACGALAHAAKHRKAAADQARAAAVSATALGSASAYASRVAGKGAAYALNPLADKIRLEARAKGRSVPTSSAPTLFSAGDVPSFTASGIPAESVLDVPWQARHAMASAPTAAEAYSIAEQCTGADAAETAEMLYGDHPGNLDFAYRAEQWRLQSLTDDQLVNEGGTAATEERRRRESAHGDMPLPDADQAIIDGLAGGGRVSGNGRVPGQPSDSARFR